MVRDGPLAASDPRLVENLAVAPPAPKKCRPLLPPTDPNEIEAFERAAIQRDFEASMAKMVPISIEEADPWLLEALENHQAASV